MIERGISTDLGGDMRLGSNRAVAALALVFGVLAFVSHRFWIGLGLDYGSFKLAAFDWVQELPRWFRISKPPNIRDRRKRVDVNMLRRDHFK